jgi:hypothetical protein
MRLNFSSKVDECINWYSFKYREYCSLLYEDSWIWSENIIKEYYREEAHRREDEIYLAITERLSRDLPFGHSGHNTVKIPWRTKMLHVSYEDIGEKERIILDLEILTS